MADSPRTDSLTGAAIAAGRNAPSGIVVVTEHSLYPCDDEGDRWFVRRLTDLFPERVHRRRAGGGCDAAIAQGSSPASANATAGAPEPDAKRICALIVGADVDVDALASDPAPDRLVIVVTGGSPDAYLTTMRQLHAATGVQVELCFRSAAAQQRFARPGRIVIPPIEWPDAQHRARRTNQRDADTFVVGYVAPREESVLAPMDVERWRNLARTGMRVRLRGANRLRESLGSDPNIDIRSRQRESLSAFLLDLDCLIYDPPRPDHEGWAIELFTAMALETPVICAARSCYSSYVGDGHRGLISHDEEALLRVIGRLRTKSEDAARSVAAAKAFAAETLSIEALRQSYQWMMAEPEPIANG